MSKSDEEKIELPVMYTSASVMLLCGLIIYYVNDMKPQKWMPFMTKMYILGAAHIICLAALVIFTVFSYLQYYNGDNQS